jgi:hypothetical protein
VVLDNDFFSVIIYEIGKSRAKTVLCLIVVASYIWLRQAGQFDFKGLSSPKLLPASQKRKRLLLLEFHFIYIFFACFQ